jgi:hypothetical protein
MRDSFPYQYVIYYTESFYYLCCWCFYYFVLCDTDNVLYKYIERLSDNRKMVDCKSRIISSSHAIILSSFSVLYLNKMISYEYWTTFLPVCSSFGLFDLSLVTMYYSIFKKAYIPILIHHNLLIFGPLLVTPENSHIMAQAFLFEITVPILDYNWYLYHTNQTQTMVFKANSVASILSFFLFRVANNCYLLTQSLQYNLKFQFVTFMFLLLNIHWFLNLVKLFVRQS